MLLETLLKCEAWHTLGREDEDTNTETHDSPPCLRMLRETIKLEVVKKEVIHSLDK